jgi:hypothetical protein
MGDNTRQVGLDSVAFPANGGAILLVGARESGKRTIRSVLLSEPDSSVKRPFEAQRTAINCSSLRLFGNISLCVVDLEPPVSARDAAELARLLRENRVVALVFLVDVTKTDSPASWNWIRAVTELTVAKQTPIPQRFVLIHKTDTAPASTRSAVLHFLGKHCCEAGSIDRTRCFFTSIWDASLYHAWSTIACALLPESMELLNALQGICHQLPVRLAVLFESVSLLTLGYAGTLLPHRRSQEVNQSAVPVRANRWLAWLGSGGGSERDSHTQTDASDRQTNVSDQRAQRRTRWPWQKPERCASAPNLQGSKMVENPEPFSLADAEAFEKMGLVLKRLRLACIRADTMFEAVELLHIAGDALLEMLTPHTFLLLCLKDHHEQGHDRKTMRANVRNALAPYAHCFKTL